MRLPLLICMIPLLVFRGQGMASGADEPAARFTIRADWFDRGNVRVSRPGESYADKHACIWNGGTQPNQSEYDIDFPVTADYTFVALYAADDSRPVDIYLDGEKIHRGFSGVTGSWRTASAQWEVQCTISVTEGPHTIKLVCPGPCMPHICAFRLESPLDFPADWTLDRPAAARARRASRPEVSGVEPHLVPEHPILLESDLETEVLPLEELASGAETNNELSIDDRVFSELSTPWIARVKASGGEEAMINLDPGRLRQMLERLVRWIDDFRTMPGVGPNFLQPRRARALKIKAKLDRLSRAPDNRGKWEEFLSLYLPATRLQRDVGLSNPLLDFDRLLLVRRGRASPRMGLPQNWQSNCVLPRSGFDDEIAVLSPVRPAGTLSTLYRPDKEVFVGDVDLHFDAGKMLFSSIGSHDRWQIFEIKADGTGLRQVTLGDQKDVDNYDACYLPDGRIIFGSTASMVAVPCVNGSTRVANLYIMDEDGTGIRQLCFDQEHNWYPTVLENGRVLYLRWEYTDTPHSHDRVLFHMNPDGTGQMEYYGSNSYWPNSLFYARPIPDHPTKFVGIVSGHHGVPRMGELVLFDSARGRREAEGAIQRIPGHGREVEARIEDNLVDDSWPKFLHPFPLSDKYFLVAAQPAPESPWAIYLADAFDNMVLIKQQPGDALLEPVPLRETKKPPVIPDRVDLARDDARVYMSDVHAGDGLKGIPRGTVKKLRLISYHYLYPGMGGPQGVVGMEGPWDIKRIVGTVPVEEDGSAMFRVPANTPIAVQPLDEEGKALQLMRSWFTAMPGEVLSCVGCHESQNTAPPAKMTQAMRIPPAEITPWHGPARGFSFEREVQPVLDEYCIGCHDGQSREGDKPLADLRGSRRITDYSSAYHDGGEDAGHFSTSYVELHRFVRRPGLESDYHLLTPMEFHADTTQLVQLLAKNHHGVQLDEEAWDRLITWIDLNAPFHGTWGEIAGRNKVAPFAQRRRELRELYADMHDDPEMIPDTGQTAVNPIAPTPRRAAAAEPPTCPDWPFGAEEAKRRQQADGPAEQTVELAEGVSLKMVRIPAGEFIMGGSAGQADERPPCRVAVDEPFWMGALEITNRQFALFDPLHDSGVESRFAMQFGVRGFYVNGSEQPVVRVSWQKAMAFCRWLSRKTGRRFTLPTEAQWEYACRAGTATPLFYGDLDTDFGEFANLADATLSEYVCHPYRKDRVPLANASPYDDWIPKDPRYDDGGFVSDGVGNYRPNAWGLYDMHGNVWEWTRSDFRPYPYRRDDGRNGLSPETNKVVRGGSWRDRPLRARSAFRLSYRPCQPVYNVGFRVVCEEISPVVATRE
ncbi:MAG: SUMF1/EgtB/PvdO family nonheme iron enzyme [Planctomycetota bacterium]